MIVDAGTFDWGNGKFPLMSQPSAAYHGPVHWDAFGFGSDICKMLGVPDNRNVAFALRARARGCGTGVQRSASTASCYQGLKPQPAGGTPHRERHGPGDLAE